MAALEAHSDGADAESSARRFELLLHLALNLPQPILIAQPLEEANTLHRLVDAIQVFATPCYLAATPGTSYERILEELRLTALQELSLPLSMELTEALALYGRERRLLALLIDEADALLPGLLSALCEFARAHPSLRVIFALGAEGMARKAATEPMAVREAYALDLAEEASPTPINPLWSRLALGLGGLAVVLMLGAVLALIGQPTDHVAPNPPEPTAQQVPETPPHQADTQPKVPEAPAAEPPALPLGQPLEAIPLPSPAAFPALVPEPEAAQPALPPVAPPAPPAEKAHPAVEEHSPAPHEPPAEIPKEAPHAPPPPHAAPAEAPREAPHAPPAETAVGHPHAPPIHHEPAAKPEPPARKLKAGVVKPAEKPALPNAKKAEAAEPAAPLPDANVVIEGVNSVEWLLAQNPDAYVLQVVAVSQVNTLARVVQKFPPDSPLAAMRSRKGRSDLYLLFYGLYPTLAAARDGAVAIPAALGRPVPRSIKAIQVDILRTNAQRGTVQAPHAAHFP